MTEQIHIEGMDDLMRKLTNLKQMKGVIGVMHAAALHLKGKIKIYPPAGGGNMPSATHKWYERGYGWKFPGGGGIKTSEMLGRSWADSAGQQANGFYAKVGTNVSYAQKVQGPNQAGKFAHIGWSTTTKVMDEERDTIFTMVKTQIDNILAGR